MKTGTEWADAANQAAKETPSCRERMHLRYGLNIGDHWRELASGPASDALITSVRDAGTELVRVFLRPDGKPPADHWRECVAFLDTIQQSGAIPMLVFAGPSNWRETDALRRFSNDCREFARRCVHQWGNQTVESWWWSIGDEPNSPWTNGGLTFEAYRDIYEATAYALQQELGPSPGRCRIGGPSVDGFQPFWFDWIWRFIEEIERSLIGFVAWNRYGDWREPGAWSAPSDPAIFEKLLLSRTGEYWSRAQAVGLLLQERGILNICSELNAHSHTDPHVSSRFNQGLFGAVYYSSALIDLMRGGADGEFLYAGLCDRGPSCALNARGGTTPAYEAKKLIARNVRAGDWISFPLDSDPEPELDAVVASDQAGRTAAVLVHRGAAGREVKLERWPGLGGFSQAALISGNHRDPQRHQAVQGALKFDGYGVALLDNDGNA